MGPRVRGDDSWRELRGSDAVRLQRKRQPKTFQYAFSFFVISEIGVFSRM